MNPKDMSRTLQRNRGRFAAAWLICLTSLGYGAAVSAAVPELGLPQQISGPWMSRLASPDLSGLVEVALSEDGFAISGQPIAATVASVHRTLDGRARGISFSVSGVPAGGVLTLLDAAARELWSSDGQGAAKVNLTDLDAIGEVVFRYEGPIETLSKVEVSGLTITAGDLPERGADGFIETASLAELRGYVHLDGVKVRLQPGTYRLNESLYHHFLEVTGDDLVIDKSDVVIQADTRLFSEFGVTPGEGGFYSVVDLTGDRVEWIGGTVETYGDQPGIQPRNKIFNITGLDVTLRDTTVQTAGSIPWGYGSLFGISGDPVRKMNGIRIGYPAERTKLLDCTVHMRAMGHGIFVQGALDTLIDGCSVDGLLRRTDDILAETRGMAFDRDFMVKGSGEGVPPTEDGKVPPGEMVSLSEDGIRLYTRGGPRNEKARDTGRTVIRNVTVRNMRRGICTGFGASPNLIVNAEATNNVQAGFHLGSNDVLVGSRADATYSEALIIPGNDTTGVRVDLQVLDSNGGGINTLVAGVNGSGHAITLWSEDKSDVPASMQIALGTTRGFIGRDEYGPDFPEGTARDVTLVNLTSAKVSPSERVEGLTLK